MAQTFVATHAKSKSQQSKDGLVFDLVSQNVDQNKQRHDDSEPACVAQQANQQSRPKKERKNRVQMLCTPLMLLAPRIAVALDHLPGARYRQDSIKCLARQCAEIGQHAQESPRRKEGTKPLSGEKITGAP